MKTHAAGSPGSARRVVVGPGGLVSDGPPPCVQDRHGVEIAELWRAEEMLRASTDGGEPEDAPWEMVPRPGGLAWRLVRFGSSSPELHQTDTLDFLTVLEGRIELEHPGGRVRLAAGDSVVIQDAVHAWHLIDDEPCTVIAFMARPRPGG